MSPLDIDIYGNTAVHQAAAGGHLEVLECFLSRGIDVEMKNARGHTSYDLADLTGKLIIAVIWRSLGQLPVRYPDMHE